MVVDGYRQGALRGFLADHVLVEDRVDFLRTGQSIEVEAGRRRGNYRFLIDDLVAEVDALVADVDARPGDQLLYLPLRLATEAAEELLVAIGRTCQRSSLLGSEWARLVPL
jgi:hypothetical protein